MTYPRSHCRTQQAGPELDSGMTGTPPPPSAHPRLLYAPGSRHSADLQGSHHRGNSWGGPSLNTAARGRAGPGWACNVPLRPHPSFLGPWQTCEHVQVWAAFYSALALRVWERPFPAHWSSRSAHCELPCHLQGLYCFLSSWQHAGRHPLLPSPSHRLTAGVLQPRKSTQQQGAPH